MTELFLAQIYHKRLSPRVNEFLYSGFYINISLNKLNELSSWIFGVNKIRPFSFFTKDHGNRDGSDLIAWAKEKLIKSGLELNEGGEFFLQTFPRVMGHVFNPVSFWRYYEGQELKAIICEVNNTFGETHSYVLKGDFSRGKHLNKKFHVSPFYDVSGKYKFDFSEENRVSIDLFDEGELKLVTSITGKKIDWNYFNQFKLLIRFPFYSFIILFLIHYQALKLFFKKTKFYTKPTKPKNEVTYEY